MIYDKPPVVLISVLKSDQLDSINAHIARYLLTHTNEAAELSI